MDHTHRSYHNKLKAYNKVIIAEIMSNSTCFRPSLVVLATTLLSLLFGTNAQIFTSVNFDKGIPCDAPITLNTGGRALPRFVPVNKTCFIQMTTDDAVARGSTAFLPFRFNVANVFDFTVRFKYRMFGRALDIGDGLAFVLHNDPRGPTALGGLGGQLGIYGTGLITPAIVVEFDSGKSNPIFCFPMHRFSHTTIHEQCETQSLEITLRLQFMFVPLLEPTLLRLLRYRPL